MDSFDAAKAPLVSFALVLAAGLVGSVLAKKLRVPDIVVFLLLGLGLGSAAPDLLGIRQTSTLNQVIVTSGACFLLFEGGMTLQFKVLKEVWISLVVLATVGVLVTGALLYAVLSHAADGFNNCEVDLRLEETVSGTTQIVTYKTHSLKLQKPFTSDFDEH